MDTFYFILLKNHTKNGTFLLPIQLKILILIEKDKKKNKILVGELKCKKWVKGIVFS